MNAGVYVITAPSGKRYVGSAVNFARRWQVHRARLKAGTHHNRPLQAAYDKHGLEGLSFARLIVCRPEQAVMYEQIALDALRPELNVAPQAGNTLGYRHTEETRAKFATRRRRTYTFEQVVAQVAKVRRPMTPEQRAAHAERMSRRDYTVSAETREKLRQANLGKKLGPMSDEHKAKIGAANKGRKPSAAAAAARVGMKQSPETIAKRVAARSATMAARKAA